VTSIAVVTLYRIYRKLNIGSYRPNKRPKLDFLCSPLVPLTDGPGSGGEGLGRLPPGRSDRGGRAGRVFAGGGDTEPGTEVFELLIGLGAGFGCVLGLRSGNSIEER
jgi:hypothetical protein